MILWVRILGTEVFCIEFEGPQKPEPEKDDEEPFGFVGDDNE